MKFVVVGLDSVQPCWENFSSDLKRKIIFFYAKNNNNNEDIS